MGIDQNNDGIGEPVMVYKKPSVSSKQQVDPIPVSDEFNSPEQGLQWQWQANPEPEWCFASAMGYLRLNCVMAPESSQNLWDIPNLYLQKFPAEEFTATTKINFQPKEEGDIAGLVMMGEDYAYIASGFSEGKTWITFTTCKNARTGGEETKIEKVAIDKTTIFFRVKVSKGGKCRFSYSQNGKTFTNMGQEFTARAGRWIGAKMGIFALKSTPTNDSGYADFDWFRVE
jgi:beta-xylosidase